MTWVRLDDQFADNPKLERAGPLAGWLHVSALCYCARHLTDGVIPWEKASRLIGSPSKPLQALIRENVWHKEGHDCPTCPPCPPHHYLIHDYLDYQKSRAEVERERGSARERMANARRNKRGSSPEHPPKDEGTSGNPDPSSTNVTTPQPPPSGGAESQHHGQHANCRQCRTNPRAQAAADEVAARLAAAAEAEERTRTAAERGSFTPPPMDALTAARQHLPEGTP